MNHENLRKTLAGISAVVMASSMVGVPSSAATSTISINSGDESVNVDENASPFQLTVSDVEETEIVTWASDTPGVASVDENGMVTVHMQGSTIITAQIQDTEVKDTITINVKDVASYNLKIDDKNAYEYTVTEGQLTGLTTDAVLTEVKNKITASFESNEGHADWTLDTDYEYSVSEEASQSDATKKVFTVSLAPKNEAFVLAGSGNTNLTVTVTEYVKTSVTPTISGDTTSDYVVPVTTLDDPETKKAAYIEDNGILALSGVAGMTVGVDYTYAITSDGDKYTATFTILNTTGYVIDREAALEEDSTVNINAEGTVMTKTVTVKTSASPVEISPRITYKAPEKNAEGVVTDADLMKAIDLAYDEATNTVSFNMVVDKLASVTGLKTDVANIANKLYAITGIDGFYYDDPDITSSAVTVNRLVDPKTATCKITFALNDAGENVYSLGEDSVTTLNFKVTFVEKKQLTLGYPETYAPTKTFPASIIDVDALPDDESASDLLTDDILAAVKDAAKGEITGLEGLTEGTDYSLEFTLKNINNYWGYDNVAVLTFDIKVTILNTSTYMFEGDKTVDETSLANSLVIIENPSQISIVPVLTVSGDNYDSKNKVMTVNVPVGATDDEKKAAAVEQFREAVTVAIYGPVFSGLFPDATVPVMDTLVENQDYVITTQVDDSILTPSLEVAFELTAAGQCDYDVTSYGRTDVIIGDPITVKKVDSITGVSINFVVIKPENVKAAAGKGKVTVTWDEVEGATQYRVQRSTGSSWTTVSYPKTTSYVDEAVTAGTEYSYRVLAYVDGEWSAASDVVKATPKASEIPQNVKAAAGDGKVTVTWDAVEDATKYRVQRYNGTSWASVSYPTTTSYVDTNVTNGTAYSYRVLAYVDGAWSGASSVVKATPKAVIIPQNVKAAADSKKVTITWSAVTGATKYRVQRTTGTTWSTVSYPTATSYVDTTVTNGTTYSYRVLAYVNGAWSAASSVVKATPSAAVKNVTAAANNKQVTVKWSAVNGATKYRVQRLNGTSWSTVSYPTSASYTDKNLTNGTAYSYRILAYVDGAWGPASSVVKATPTAVPQNVKATAGTKSATISWTAVSGATKYRVQRYNGKSWATVSYPTAASYTDTGLTTGTTYQYRVLAYVDGAWSAASAAVSVTAK